MAKRIFALDFFKAVAILLIVLSHLDNYVQFTFFQKCDDLFAYIGLYSFFFISGFTLTLTNKRSSRIDYHNFFKKRILRIYPVYWFALATSYLVFELINVKSEPVIYDFSPMNLIVHTLGLQGIFYNFEIYGMWFVGVILMFYAIFPLLVKNSGELYNIIISSSFVFIAFLFFKIAFGIVDLNVFRYYFTFVAGIVIANKYVIHSHKGNMSDCSVHDISENIMSQVLDDLIQIKNILIFYTFMGFCCLVYLLNYKGTSIFTIFRYVFYFFFVAIFVYLVSLVVLNVYTDSKLLRVGKKKRDLVSQISYCSYSVYLFHLPILSLINALLQLVLTAALKDIFLILFGIPLVLLLSYHFQIINDKYVISLFSK